MATLPLPNHASTRRVRTIVSGALLLLVTPLAVWVASQALPRASDGMPVEWQALSVFLVIVFLVGGTVSLTDEILRRRAFAEAVAKAGIKDIKKVLRRDPSLHDIGFCFGISSMGWTIAARFPDLGLMNETTGPILMAALVVAIATYHFRNALGSPWRVAALFGVAGSISTFLIAWVVVRTMAGIAAGLVSGQPVSLPALGLALPGSIGLLIALAYAVEQLPRPWLLWPLHTSDFGLTMERAAKWREWVPYSRLARQAQGAALHYGDRLAEAEAVYRDLTGDERELTSLAAVLGEQGKYGEAEDILRVAAERAKTACLSRWVLGELQMRQGGDPGQALRLIDEALLAAAKQKRAMRYRLAGMIADRAWALAACGRTSEARTECQRAVEARLDGFLPLAASAAFRLGRAWQAIGETEQAAQFFGEAQTLEPKGLYARLSREAHRGEQSAA